MALTKVTYVDNVTVIGATNLNAIQDEIIANGNNISSLQSGKVDKDGNKVLSTNDFTNENLSKLNGIEPQATRVLVDTALSGLSTNAIQNKAVKDALDEQSQRIDNASSSVADVYTQQAYSIGDYVTHDNKLYRAIVDIPTAEVWDETHWEEINVADVVAELQEDTAEVKNIAFAGFPTDTASGAIATFPDGADNVPIKNLSVAIEPVQDLHGQDAPYPAGGGKNLFDKTAVGSDNKYITSAGGQITPSDSTQWRISDYIPVVPGQAYTISGMNGAGGSTPGCRFYSADKSEGITGASYLGASTKTVTAPENAYWLRISVTYDTLDIAQVELGSTATSYAPYSNICSISGHTECNVTRCGKNVYDASSDVTGSRIDADGTIVTSSGMQYSQLIPVESGSEYMFSLLSASNSTSYTVNGYGEDGAWKTNLVNASTTASGRRYTHSISVPDGVCYVRISRSTTRVKEVQLERSSTATDYEEYLGTTYPITFPNGTGTVYGGNITVNQDGTGELVVTKSAKTFDDMSSWTEASGVYTINDSLNEFVYETGAVWLCNKYKYIRHITNLSYASDDGFYTNYNATYHTRIVIKDSNYQSLSAFTASLATTPITVCGILAEPISIALTASQITTLLGQNNVWADCNGDVSVTYRADALMYIDEEIAETKSSLGTLLPSAIVTKRAYIQNGELTQNDRALSITDGVLTLSSISTASTTRLGIIITGEMSYSSSTVSSFTPPINSLLPVIKGVNAVRTLIYDATTAGNVAYAVIYWCNISNDTVNVVERTELWSNTDEGLVLKQFTIPETATHYAIRIYWATVFEQTNKVRMEFTAI